LSVIDIQAVQDLEWHAELETDWRGRVHVAKSLEEVYIVL
jgi:hypothetical protein